MELKMKRTFPILLALAAGAFLSLPAVAQTNEGSVVSHTTTYNHGILERTATYNVDGDQKAPNYGSLSPAAGGSHHRTGFLGEPQTAMGGNGKGHEHHGGRGHHKHHEKKHHRDHHESLHKE
jgi:hypothetical protein